MRLMRELRCFPAAESSDSCVRNSWAGDISGEDIESFWLLRAVVEGQVDDRTGYLCDIKAIDALLRDTVIPRLRGGSGGGPGTTRALVPALRDAFNIAAQSIPAPSVLKSLELKISPFTSLAVGQGERDMVSLTRAFEFSAAHRLYCESFSDEKNLQVFGKCSNPHGHGHNYMLEVTVSGTPDEVTGTLIEMGRLDRIVKERVIDSFDHKNLNVECDEFASLNPSVENIARVVWARLDGALGRCRLANVRVWETPKTYAEYSGGQ
jgi:6-pyruvoyltetrahydropterin/6-carboxytetrahydropterin synthase